MNGGQTITTGVILVLVALCLMTVGGTFGAMVSLIGGSLPLIALLAGGLLLAVAIADWRSKRAEGTPAETGTS